MKQTIIIVALAALVLTGCKKKLVLDPEVYQKAFDSCMEKAESKLITARVFSPTDECSNHAYNVAVLDAKMKRSSGR